MQEYQDKYDGGDATFRVTTAFIIACACLSTASVSEVYAIPEQGKTLTFTYEREKTESEAFLVYPVETRNGSPIAVSSNFLALALRDAPVDDATRLKLIRRYPEMMEALYDEKMEENYPDMRIVHDTPFQPYVGTGITITQDPLSPPYVRVSIRMQTGELKQFSINRDTVETLLADRAMTDETTLVAALRDYPYRLPERARTSFRELTAEDIFAIAEQDIEGVRRQEFVKSREWQEEAEERQKPRRSLPPALSVSAAQSSPTIDKQPPSATERVNLPAPPRPTHASPADKRAPINSKPAAPPPRRILERSTLSTVLSAVGFLVFGLVSGTLALIRSRGH